MSSGGIYPGPGGVALHGDGRPVGSPPDIDTNIDTPPRLEDSDPELAEHIRLMANGTHETMIAFSLHPDMHVFKTRLGMKWWGQTPGDKAAREAARLKRERKANR